MAGSLNNELGISPTPDSSDVFDGPTGRTHEYDWFISDSEAVRTVDFLLGLEGIHRLHHMELEEPPEGVTQQADNDDGEWFQENVALLSRVLPETSVLTLTFAVPPCVVRITTPEALRQITGDYPPGNPEAYRLSIGVTGDQPPSWLQVEAA